MTSPRILVLYDATQTYTNTVFDHLQSLAALEGADVCFAHTTPDTAVPVPLTAFDIVIVHYSVRVAFDRMSASDAGALTRFRGLKCLFIQDEYDHTETSRRVVERLGLHVVFTCVPAAGRDRIYPTSRFPDVTFVTNLTGYVPAHLGALPVRPPSQRAIVIGYRGRRLPFRYGRLAQEKWTIGERMRLICDARGIVTDISSDERARIYGDAWFTFLGSCRGVLATESGSNVFDDDGSIQRRVDARLADEPMASFEDVYRDCLAGVEQDGLMNQVSPRIFEAIACRTALILFEGTYSGVVRPGVHYLALRKDFANVEDVLAALADDALVRRLTERAYDDVIASGIYGYPAFSRMVSGTLSSERAARRHVLGGAARDGGRAVAHAVRCGALSTAPIRAMPPGTVWVDTQGRPSPLPGGVAGRLRHALLPIWQAAPESARTRLRPIARALLGAFEAPRA